MSDEDFMKLALNKASAGVEAGQSPFGACIVNEGQVIACEHNKVWADTDITAHAEVVAIRAACQALQSIDLSGAVIYTTCEPCPMCFSACHWARLDKIYFAATITDAQKAGFHELEIRSEDMKQLGKSKIEVEGGILAEEAQELFREWVDSATGKTY